MTACASAPPSPEALANNDPFETTNRQTLALNGQIDRYFVVPTVGLYFIAVPPGGRRGVHNFLSNLSLPTTFINDVLQGEATRGSQTVERFLINTTLGLGGFFDPASHMGIPGHGEDFGQTLAVWGVGEGPFLMLPFLGPSNPRDTAGLAVDIATSIPPITSISSSIYGGTAGREYFTVLDLRGQTYQTIQGIQRSSVDYYASLRSLYRQLRNTEIRNGRPPQASGFAGFLILSLTALNLPQAHSNLKQKEITGPTMTMPTPQAILKRSFLETGRCRAAVRRAGAADRRARLRRRSRPSSLVTDNIHKGLDHAQQQIPVDGTAPHPVRGNSCWD